MKQTVKKGNYYGFIGSGYSYGKGQGYKKIFIVTAKIDGFDEYPTHWNREFFDVVERTGKLHASGINTEFSRKINALNKEYKGLIWA